MPRWDRDMAGRLISRRKVTSWTNIPTMVIDLLASPNFASYDLSSLIYIGGGGAAMPQAMAQRLFEQYGLKYQEGYGLTETAAPSHANPFENPKQQCLGIPYMSTDSRVVDPETLKELPIGESGEIIMHGPEVFQGYWKRPDATAAAFIEFEGKRFFRYRRHGPDGRGRLLLHDRPAQADDQRERLQGLAGRGRTADVPATRRSRRPASSPPRMPTAANRSRRWWCCAPTHKDTTEQQIIDWCRENMAVYKIPRKVQFVDAACPRAAAAR